MEYGEFKKLVAAGLVERSGEGHGKDQIKACLDENEDVIQEGYARGEQAVTDGLAHGFNAAASSTAYALWMMV